MLRHLLSCLTFIVFSAPVAAKIEIKFQTQIAEQVLADVCSQKAIDETDIRDSIAIQKMVAHFAQFRDYFTVDAYIDARQKAANCEKSERDMFRFNEVIDRRDQLRQEVAQFREQSDDISSEISEMLRPYAPKGLNYSGQAAIMIGTPSCGGWSVGPDFYLDLPCISDDPNGLRYLVAHESYHGIQNAFMYKPDEVDWVGKLLSETLREGSAAAIADFSEIEGGSYTKLSQDSLKKNERRLKDNYSLLDMATGYLIRYPTKQAYASANNIGLSGQFDAPFYSVGSNIFNAIERQYGTDVLVCLLAQPPEHMFGLYASLSGQTSDLPSLGPDLASVIAERATSEGLDRCLGALNKVD